jgi:hypothetical protein
MSWLAKLRAAVRRLGLWILAAAIALAVLFSAVLVYKWTVYQPDPPPLADCTSLQLLTSSDGAAELQLHSCKRGRQPAWQGYELWLFEPLNGNWTRIMTAEQQPQDGQQHCLNIGWRNQTTLVVAHSQSRGDLALAKNSVVYHDVNDKPHTLSIATERVDLCQLTELHD